MGKVKDEQLFSLLRDFLLIYLPNQRHASNNTVKAYRTAWNQLLKYIAGQKKIPMMSVTFEMIRYEMVVAYLDWLSEEKIRHVKNFYPTDSMIGCEDYAYFDKYMITTASWFYIAHIM